MTSKMLNGINYYEYVFQFVHMALNAIMNTYSSDAQAFFPPGGRTVRFSGFRNPIHLVLTMAWSFARPNATVLSLFTAPAP